jgi:arylsulfatase A-like enzyme
MFGKMSNFEIATRSPLIISLPDSPGEGIKLNHLTESIDIYPTLAELCGLEFPDDLDGESLVDILNNPDSKGQNFARSFYYRNKALGKTIRTDQYRIVKWATENDRTVALELYDHELDPNENINIAAEQKVTTDSLLKLLKTVKYMDEDLPFQNGWE